MAAASIDIPQDIALLLQEPGVPPEHHADGIPTEEMKQPTVSVLPPHRSSFKPSLVKRCDVDPAPLLALLEKEGQEAWDPAVQEKSNVPFDRPAHDKWGVGKIMFIHCDDFMKRCYYMPWWNERSEWREVIEPYFKALNVPTERIVRCLLAKLPPGVIIPVHHDTGHWVPRTHRLHVPVVTNDKVIFKAGMTEDLMQRYSLSVGSIYELNNQSKHYVSNWGEECRTHLIFDYIDPDMTRPPLEILDRGEAVFQTRRSIDRAKHQGSSVQGPTFIILGAQKSGTTALYEYIHQHPLVLKGCRRESHAFDWRWENKAKTTEEKRRFCFNRFFDMNKLYTYPSIISGDSIPSYLLHSNVVLPRMIEVVPWAKLFVCMRDPVLRAFSHYQMVVDTEGTPAQLLTRGRSHWVDKSFAQVVSEELAMLESLNITADSTYEEFKNKYLENEKLCPMGHGGHSLVARGLYALQLEPWLAAFPLCSFTTSQVEVADAAGTTNKQQGKLMVVRLEDLQSNTSQIMSQVFQHVGLDPVELEDSSAKNARTYRPLDESIDLKNPPDGLDVSNEQAAARLRAFYKPHNMRLEKLLEVPEFTRAWKPKSKP